MWIREPEPGENVEHTARRLCAAAQIHGEARAKFNDVELLATPESTAAGVVESFLAECNRRSTAYWQSPKGQAAKREAEEQVKAMQERHDELMLALPSLDFTNAGDVLDWLCAMQGASDHVGVTVRKAEILSAFAAGGFLPGVNCGDDFRRGDRDNELHWLVGQALDTLENVGAIHGIVLKFAADWRRDHGQ